MEGNKCIFENNYADDYGGAIYIKTKSESTIKNTQFTNNQAKDNNGGAIYSNGDLRVSNCNFTKNKAKTDGGAIYADAKVTATSSIFIINEAAGASSQCYAGAIYCTNIDCDKCIFDNNHAYDYGGAIYINNKGKSTIKNSKFTNNKADDYNGGAIYSKKNIEVYNSLFKNNQANNSWSPSTSQGGAIYCGTITCNNCTFENNKAKKYAGAIYINDKEVSTIKNSKFINNTSPFNGGAINANGKLIVESSIFKNNKADHFGGALEPYENGGAIFCLNIDCNNSTFENNYAESYGGAIFIKTKENPPSKTQNSYKTKLVKTMEEQFILKEI
ncbi:MAG: right-handed parallel beta-helix repeat-containing protein [Methanobrevibacter sp.]|uniref:right-handed parallel beta-helix repeat-containing protein n=1 Tax=Methanobrevibacter sp. TaxID=66852 RepID=UPI003EFDBA66